MVAVPRRRQTKTIAAVTRTAPATSHQPAGDQGRVTGGRPRRVLASLTGIISTSVRSGTVRQGF